MNTNVSIVMPYHGKLIINPDDTQHGRRWDIDSDNPFKTHCALADFLHLQVPLGEVEIIYGFLKPENVAPPGSHVDYSEDALWMTGHIGNVKYSVIHKTMYQALSRLHSLLTIGNLYDALSNGVQESIVLRASTVFNGSWIKEWSNHD